MATIIRTAGLSLILLAILICVSILFLGDVQAINASSVILAGLLIYLGLASYFAFRHRKWRVTRVEACVLAVVLWCFIPLPGAMALMTLMDMRLIDALFEAYSGFTTTGASTLESFDDVPNSVIVLRSLMQWVGGIMTLAIVVVVLAPLGIGGLPPSQATIVNREITVLHGRVDRPVLAIATGYLALTILCFAALVFSQVPAFEAFNLALSTVSSGGFVSSSTPINGIGSFATPSVLALFMIVAGTSIVWQSLLVNGRTQSLKIHRETYYYFLAIVLLTVTYAAVFYQRAGSSAVLNPLDALNEGLFTAASLVSTTGFEIRTGSFSVLPIALVLMIALIGGCSFSTAGGITFFRLGGMARHSIADLTKLVYPNSVDASRFGSQRYDLTLIKAIWTHFFSVTLVVMLGTLFLALQLDSFEAALVASIAAFSNIGAFYSTGWNETGQWTTYAEMADSSKVILCILMILGRLYLLTLLTALNVTYWVRAR